MPSMSDLVWQTLRVKGERGSEPAYGATFGQTMDVRGVMEGTSALSVQHGFSHELPLSPHEWTA